MNTKVDLGIILLVPGLILLLYGVISSHWSDPIPNTLLGLFSYKTAISVFGGAMAALYGLALIVLGAQQQRS
jgi:hypothetical protein